MTGVAAADSAGVVRRRGFRVREERTEDGALHVYGDRHQYTKMATLLTHLGLILFLVAAAVTSRLGDEQGLVVPEGESLTVQPIGTPGLLLVKNLGFDAPGFRDRACRPTSRPTWPSTAMARRSPARRSGSTTRCRSPGYTFHQNGFGPAPHLVVRDASRQRAVGRPGPADRRGRRPAVRDPGRARPRPRPAAAPRPREPTAWAGSSSCRIGSSAPTRTACPSPENFEPVGLHGRRDQGLGRAGTVGVARRVRRVHAAHRQVGPGPGHHLARLPVAHRRHHHHVLPAAPAGLGAAGAGRRRSAWSGAPTATSTSSGSSGGCWTTSWRSADRARLGGVMASLHDLHRALFPTARPADGTALTAGASRSRGRLGAGAQGAGPPASRPSSPGDLAIVPGPELVVAAARRRPHRRAGRGARAGRRAGRAPGRGGRTVTRPSRALGASRRRAAGLTALRLGRTDPMRPRAQHHRLPGQPSGGAGPAGGRAGGAARPVCAARARAGCPGGRHRVVPRPGRRHRGSHRRATGGPCAGGRAGSRRPRSPATSPGRPAGPRCASGSPGRPATLGPVAGWSCSATSRRTSSSGSPRSGSPGCSAWSWRGTRPSARRARRASAGEPLPEDGPPWVVLLASQGQA